MTAARRRARGLRQFHEAAGGAVEMRLIRAEATVQMLSEPGPTAGAFRQALARFLKLLSRQSCLLCGRSFGRTEPPADWVLILPAGHPAPDHVMLSGICADCGADRSNAELRTAAAEMLRQMAWPDLRELDPASVAPGGRA